MARPRGAPSAQPAFPQPLRTSLAEATADAIAEAIATRVLKPGARVTEQGAGAELGVSRVTMREALKVLHAQGLLLGGGTHRGFRVAPFDQTTVRRVREVRVGLETILLRDALTAWRAGQSGLQGLTDALEEMRRAARAGDMRAALRADVAFHRAIRAASGNHVAGPLWDAIARHVLIIFTLERGHEAAAEIVLGQHEDLLATIERLLAEQPSEAALRDILWHHIVELGEPWAGG